MKRLNISLIKLLLKLNYGKLRGVNSVNAKIKCFHAVSSEFPALFIKDIMRPSGHHPPSIGSRAGIRTPVTGAKAPHPWPLDDPATTAMLQLV